MRPNPYKMEPKTEGQRNLVNAIERNVVTFVDGPAGTGKTHIPVAIAARMLNEDKDRYGIQRIVLCRPAVSSSVDIGFLPGTLQDKMDPYMRPLFDELMRHYSAEVLQLMIANKTIEICHLGMMRGRTLWRSFIICDEAQNATIQELRMLMTRIGKGSKMVIGGDTSQCDLAGGRSPMPSIARIMREIEGIESVELSIKDCQRSSLIEHIESAFTTLLSKQHQQYPRG